MSQTKNPRIPMRIPILSLSLLAGLNFSLHASFNVPLTSVRSASLGQASIASSREAASLFLNPSGLAALTQGEVSFMYNRLYAGLPGTQDMSTGYLALALPTKIGNLGLGLGGFMAQGAKVERTLALGFARKLFKDRMELGFTAKHLFHSYSIGNDPMAQADPVFAQGTSRDALSYDIGLSAHLIGPLDMGVAARNINEPNVGLMSQDKVKREVQGGLVVHLDGIGLTLTGDLGYRAQANIAQGRANAILPYFGLEKTLNEEGLALRLGANPLEFAGGLGLKVNNLSFDYALILSRNLTLGDHQGTHRVGLTLRFSSPSRGEGSQSRGLGPTESRRDEGRVRVDSKEEREEEGNFYRVFFEE